MSREMKTCIGTRAAGLKDDRLYIQTSVGMVADSDPALADMRRAPLRSS